jgi:hypothetical protein
VGHLLQSDSNSKKVNDLPGNGGVPSSVPVAALVGHLAPSDLLTPDELAERLKVPKSWVYKQSARHGPDSIPVLRCGMYLRFSWPEVCAWLRSIKA